jgi:hypothetical protein
VNGKDVIVVLFSNWKISCFDKELNLIWNSFDTGMVILGMKMKKDKDHFSLIPPKLNCKTLLPPKFFVFCMESEKKLGTGKVNKKR